MNEAKKRLMRYLNLLKPFLFPRSEVYMPRKQVQVFPKSEIMQILHHINHYRLEAVVIDF